MSLYIKESKAEQLCQIREGFENCPRNFFWGRLKCYYFTFSGFFYYCTITRQLIVKKMLINKARNSQKKVPMTIFEALSNLAKLFSFSVTGYKGNLFCAKLKLTNSFFSWNFPRIRFLCKVKKY
jgi:hypothetical protein